jgi:hypothetical protein
MTFARDVRVAGRQTTSDRDRLPARPPGPASLVQQLGASVGNRSLARLIATAKLARQPQKRRDPTTADLEEWAKWPNQAHQQWKRLGTWERIAVFERMRRRYGKDFAEQFRKYAEAGKADLDSRGCEMPVCMPDPYLKQGYKVAERASYQIDLVHPSGRRRYLFGGHSTSKPPEDEVPPDDEPPIEEPPDEVDPPPPDLLRPTEPPIDFSRPRP